MMWSKLRRKLSRTKPAVEQHGDHLTSDYGQMSGTFTIGELSVQRIDANKSVLDGQEDHCRCNPLLQIQKHLFGTYRTKRTIDGCCDNRSIHELGDGTKNQDSALNISHPSNSLVNGISVNVIKVDKLNELDNNECTCHMLFDKGTVKESLPELEPSDLDFKNGDSCKDSTMENKASALSSCEVMQTSPPKLKMWERGRNRDATGSNQHSDNDVGIPASSLNAKLHDYPYHESRNASGYVYSEISHQTLLIGKSVDAIDTECCSENTTEKSAEKEGSTDSGHHLSEGDGDKDHSSPDLELDDFDGRESGYTTLDEVQSLIVEQSKLCIRNNMSDVVFEERRSLNQVLPTDQLYCYSQPLDLSMSASGHRSSCFDSSQSASVIMSSPVEPSIHVTSSVEPSVVGLRDAENISSRQWETVDYVPADASVSKIYEDSSTSGTNDVYASVPRAGSSSKTEEVLASEEFAREDSLEKRMETKKSMTSEQDDLDGSTKVVNLTPDGDLSCGNSVSSDTSVFIAPDSDDGENVPPLPQRNYELYVGSGDAEPNFSELSELENVNEQEQIHMTWEELMKEAKDMGIPLNGPHFASSSEQMPSDSNTESDISNSQISETNKRTRNSQEQLEQSLDKIISCKPEVRKGSPIKEKFRLPNLFTKRNRSDRTEKTVENDKRILVKGKKSSVFRHHSSVDIQKRCLPRPPPCEQQYNCSFLVFDQTGTANDQISSKTRPHRMAISMHLPVPDGNSAARSWGSSANILNGATGGDTGGRRSRRVFSDSSQNHNSLSACRQSFAENDNGTANCRDLSWSSDGRNENADFIQSFSKLKDCGWYWGPLGWENAEAKLEDKPDGSFLVRDSSDDRYILSLSFRSQNVTHHTRIEHYKGMFSFYSQPKSHGASTIVEFIEKAMEHSQSGRFLYFLRPRAPGLPPTPVQLLFPISRLRNMHSLQHMCRFVILKHVRHDLIDHLPMPQRLKEYLKQMQYYVEHSDCDSAGHQYFTPAW